jgi:drug/metabolite transporter (DMT)-like permease
MALNRHQALTSGQLAGSMPGPSMNALLQAIHSRYLAVPPGLRGVGLMLFSVFAFACMHATIQYVAKTGLPPFYIAFFRKFFGLLLLLPVVARNRFRDLRTRRPGLHAARGFIQVGAMLSFFYAVSITPLATTAALGFTAPLFGVIGAALVLKERLGRDRLIALIVGFAGALVIIRPGFIPLELGVILIVGSSAFWAIAMMIIKVLARADGAAAIAAYMVISLTPLTGIAALFVWQWPSLEQLAFLLLIGSFGTVAHLGFNQAMKEADAAAILPLDFTKLIWNAVLGYLVFTQIPGIWIWAGGTMIFIAATWVARSEAKARQAKAGI